MNNARKDANTNKGKICQNRTVCKDRILRGTYMDQIRKLKNNLDKSIRLVFIKLQKNITFWDF